jgi:hypothetical protein
MITSLRTAIYKRALEVDGLTTSNFFFKTLPKNLKGYPRYILTEIIAPYAGRTTVSKFEESHINFCLKGIDQNVLELVAERIRAKFDDSEPIFNNANSNYYVPDYFVLQIISKGSRDSESYEDPVDVIKQIDIQYKFLMQQK